MLTVKEAAARLKCGTKFVYSLIDAGDIRGHKLSPRRMRIEEDEIEAYLRRKRTK